MCPCYTVVATASSLFLNIHLTSIFVRDRKKEYASSKAAYYPFGVDAYLSHRKINHIARFIELPAMSSASMIPAILVVNVQVQSAE